MFDITTMALGVLITGSFIFLIVFLFKAVFLVQQAETVIIERLGRYDRTLGPGIHLTIPFIDRSRSVVWSFLKETDGRRHQRVIQTVSRLDLREAVYDFPKQNVITKDNVTMEISALLYYQITDPKAAVYEVANLPEAIEKLTQTTLRNVIGSMDLDQSLTSRDEINERLRLILDVATDKWGVKINRVELQEVNPPADIRHAMEKRMRAERDRRALILEAEGTKRAAILQAEGVQESQVLRARGEAEANLINAQSQATSRLQLAQAEAQSLHTIAQAVPGADPMAYLVALQYIKALPEMAQGKEDKLVIVPYEASALMGSVAMVRKLFANS